MIVNKIAVKWKEHVFFPKETHTKFIENSLCKHWLHISVPMPASSVSRSRTFLFTVLLSSCAPGKCTCDLLPCSSVGLGKRFWEEFSFLLSFPCYSVIHSVCPLGYSSLDLHLLAVLVDFLSKVDCSCVNRKNIFARDSSWVDHHLV